MFAGAACASAFRPGLSLAPPLSQAAGALEGSEGNNKRPREEETQLEGGDGEPEKKRASTGFLGGENGADPTPVSPAVNFEVRGEGLRGGTGPPVLRPRGRHLGLTRTNSAACPLPCPASLQAQGGPMEALDVPSAQVGKLIGKAGETIRNLQMATDTRIQVDHSGEGPTKRVTITGPSA